MRKILLLLFFFASISLFAQVKLRVAETVRVAKAPGIDGVLDDDAWENAPIIKDFVARQPVFGKPAQFPTEVKMVYDNTAIYISAYAFTPPKIFSFSGRSLYVLYFVFQLSRLTIISFTRLRNALFSDRYIFALFFQTFALPLGCLLDGFSVIFDCFTAQKYGELFYSFCTAYNKYFKSKILFLFFSIFYSLLYLIRDIKKTY